MVPRRLPVPAEVDEGADIGDLYRRHAETVARWVSRLGGPLVDVEDLVHEVFLVAQRKRPSDRGAARITTWLYRVTAKVVSHRRRKDRWRRWLRGSSVETGHRAGQSMSDGGVVPPVLKLYRSQGRHCRTSISGGIPGAEGSCRYRICTGTVLELPRRGYGEQEWLLSAPRRSAQRRG